MDESCSTRSGKIARLKRRIEELEQQTQDLEDEVQILKNPGTCSLGAIMTYTFKTKANRQEGSLAKKCKTIPYSYMMTEAAFRDELKQKADTVLKETLEKEQRKELRVQKKAEKDAEAKRRKNENTDSGGRKWWCAKLGARWQNREKKRAFFFYFCTISSICKDTIFFHKPVGNILYYCQAKFNCD